MAAGSGHFIVVDTNTIADEPADPIVSVGASGNALIATSAFIQVKHQEALGILQPLFDILLQNIFRKMRDLLLTLFCSQLALIAFGLHVVANFFGLDDFFEVLCRNADHINMVQC